MKYTYKRKPYKHQVLALRRLLRSDFGGALLMQPRTGKTKVACDFIGARNVQGVVRRVLVICPRSIMDVWAEELAANLPVPYRSTIWDRRNRKRSELPRPHPGILDVVIVNYDAFSTPGAVRKVVRDNDGNVVNRIRSRKKGGKYDVIRQLSAWGPDCIILDESHRIKKASAARTRAIVGLRDTARYRIIMTGTPVTKAKRTHDIYAQWKFLNPERFADYPTSDEFKNHYGVWTNKNGFPQFLKPKNMGELQARIHADSYAITREECFDLPPRLPDQIIPVDLDKSGPAYDDMAEQMVAELPTGEVTTASIPLVKVLRLAQITSGITRTEPSDEHPDGRLVRIGREKLTFAEEWLSDQFEAEEKVVVAARWRADIAALVKVGRKLKVPTYYLAGGMGDQLGWNWRTFQKESGPALIVCQPQVAGLGIELGTAATLLWYSLTSSWVDYSQMNDRVALSNRAVRVSFLLARGTIDEVMYEALQADGKIAEAIARNPRRLLR